MAFKSPLRLVPTIRARMDGVLGALPLTYADKVLGDGPIAYWPLWEAAGTVAECLVNPAQNGTYARNVTTMGTGVGIGDGNTAPVFDGTQDEVDIFSLTLRAAWTNAEISMMTWVKPAAGVWTDGVIRYVIELYRAAAERQDMRKQNTNNQARGFRRDAVNVIFAIKNGLTSTDWQCWFHTASAGNNRLRFYIDGVVTESAPVVAFASNVMTQAWIGSAGAADWWSGRLAHAAVFNGEFTQAQVTALSTR